jgi:hypothetical protein
MLKWHIFALSGTERGETNRGGRENVMEKMY